MSFMPPTHFGMLASMRGGRDACAIFVTATVMYGHMAPATDAVCMTLPAGELSRRSLLAK